GCREPGAGFGGRCGVLAVAGGHHRRGPDPREELRHLQAGAHAGDAGCRRALPAHRVQPDGRGRAGLSAGGAGDPQRGVRRHGASHPNAADHPRRVLGSVTAVSQLASMRPARETVRAVLLSAGEIRMRARWYMVPMLLAALLIAAPAQAWSQLGHRIVGDLAELQLHEAARAEVQRLLAGEGEPTLGGVAAWADALRHEAPDRFRTSSRWHYINARGGGCDFVASRDCAQGGCIVTAIEAQRRILADRGQTLAARRDALKFLVHFVGDIHQPLHAGPREDSGGNGFQVSLRRERASAGGDTRGSARATGTNLHTVWDSHLD